GAGKSTLLRLALGNLWPNAGGRILRCGHDRMDLRRLREQIGIVNDRLVADVPADEKVWDTVVSGRWAQIGLKHFVGFETGPEDYDRATKYLRQLGWEHLREKRFGQLSQGERQIVMVARARMVQPLMLVLDEPCAGMDPGVRERFLGALHPILEDRETPALILVTHHMEEILPGITHTLVMKQGRALAQGPTDTVLTPEVISQLYDVRVDRIEQAHGRYWPIWGAWSGNGSRTFNEAS
ncbi:MAG: ATP-binding cassette domain-containing protein, partial [Planctomycetales bacterium]|nr:ATP-binding cassette domain-containing protein [Planctomycetales bacterium]